MKVSDLNCNLPTFSTSFAMLYTHHVAFATILRSFLRLVLRAPAGAPMRQPLFRFLFSGSAVPHSLHLNTRQLVQSCA
jgi:hypothetical protein